MNDAISVSRLRPDDREPYRELRLQSLRLHPDYYGASLKEEAKLSTEEFGRRLLQGTIFGAWRDKDLVGCAGLASREKVKLKHKAIVWGMFVRPDLRGAGIGKLLLDTVLEHARIHYEEVLLTVVDGNEEACRLYRHSGFSEYGREPGAIKIGTSYYDEILLRLALTRS